MGPNTNEILVRQTFYIPQWHKNGIDNAADTCAPFSDTIKQNDVMATVEKKTIRSRIERQTVDTPSHPSSSAHCHCHSQSWFWATDSVRFRIVLGYTQSCWRLSRRCGSELKIAQRVFLFSINWNFIISTGYTHRIAISWRGSRIQPWFARLNIERNAIAEFVRNARKHRRSG